MEKKIMRGDIYLANLSPVVGSEQGGVRPVLIISNNIGNKHSPTIIIAAITSKAKIKLPTHVSVDEFKDLEKDSIVLLEQIRTLDKQRLGNYIGLLPSILMARVDQALAISIALSRGLQNEEYKNR